MKLGTDVLIEIMSIVQKGLMGQIDVSQQLRELDLKVQKETVQDPGILLLTEEYKESIKE